MKIKNFTPHDVNYFAPCGEQVTFTSSGVARVSAITESAGSYGLDGHVTETGQTIVRLIFQSFGEVEGLPDEESGVRYIVSRLVKSALPERGDLIVPADLIRDASGQIIGCRAFEV